MLWCFPPAPEKSIINNNNRHNIYSTPDPGECGGSGQPACCGTGNQLPCNQIRVYDWMQGIGIGKSIRIFDETKPFESSLSEVRIVEAIVDNPDETKIITLDSALTHSYMASSKTGSPAMPIFDNGHSAGFCFNSTDNTYYFIADTSDLQQPFSDAFVTFHITKDGFEGSNVVPYLSKIRLRLAKNIFLKTVILK